jgi:hypothetical protein
MHACIQAYKKILKELLSGLKIEGSANYGESEKMIENFIPPIFHEILFLEL